MATIPSYSYPLYSVSSIAALQALTAANVQPTGGFSIQVQSYYGVIQPPSPPVLPFEELNPTTTSGNITLSNTNRSASVSATQPGQVASYGYHFHNTGKYYIEVHYITGGTTLGGQNSCVNVGFVNSNFPTSGRFVGQDAPLSLGFHGVGGNGGFYLYNPIFNEFAPSLSDGDVIAIAIDFDNQKIWVKNVTQSSDWNATVGANPGSNTGGLDISGSMAGQPWTICANFGPFNAGETTAEVDFNFGQTAYAGVVPSGFVNWDSTTSAGAPPQALNSRGGGVFMYDVSALTSADGGVTIVDAAGRHWIRQLAPNQEVNSSMFGAKGDGVTDDYAALQAFVDYCFAATGTRTRNFSTPASESNKTAGITTNFHPCVFDPGTYNVSLDIWFPKYISGALIRGSGRVNTTKIVNTSNTVPTLLAQHKGNCFTFNGLKYSRLENIHFSSTAGVAANTTTGIGNVCVDYNDDGNGASQSNTFFNTFTDTADYGWRVGANNFMCSETLWLNTYETSHLSAGIWVGCSNATQLEKIGGNQQANGYGIYALFGEFNLIHGVGFQISNQFDVSAPGSLGGVWKIIGCRSESNNFAQLGFAQVDIDGCYHTGQGSPGIFLQQNSIFKISSSSSVSGLLKLDVSCLQGTIIETSIAQANPLFQAINCRINCIDFHVGTNHLGQGSGTPRLLIFGSIPIGSSNLDNYQDASGDGISYATSTLAQTQIANPTVGTQASLLVGFGPAPSPLVNGMMWYDGKHFNIQQNGTTLTLATAAYSAPTYNTFSTVQQNATLSGGNLVVSNSGANVGNNAWCSISNSTGKYYFEFSCVTGSGKTGGGFTNASQSSATIVGGIDNNGVLCDVSTSTVLLNNASIGSFAAYQLNQIIGVAVDLTAKKIWVKNISSSSGWNNDVLANQNPATGTGGYSFSSINAGPYFPACNDTPVGGVVTFNLGATVYTGSPPAGFGNWF